MKILFQVTRGRWQVTGNPGAARHVTRHPSHVTRRAFTLIEIAICLAIIGFALVAIIGVLPIGMSTQRDNREETIINQDATVLLNAIRSGARHADHLTNYVYAITNYWGYYDDKGVQVNAGANGYTFNAVPQVTSGIYPNAPYSSAPITNGVNIIGLLSMPEFVADVLNWPETNYPPVPYPVYSSERFGVGCYSNHVVAYIRSISGLAVEKPPQDNDIMREDALTYRLLCVNAPMPVDTNTFNNSPFAQKLAAAQRELRLTFLWPQLPNGKVGSSRLTFRATVAGQLSPTNHNNFPNQWLYFYQSQSFTNAP
jgi:prepilin-type N-terminal cleavage/methylation domain-containing protein